MDESEIAEIRRKFMRKGYLAFGLPFFCIASFGFFKAVSGDLGILIIFYILFSVIAVLCVHLWSCWMWQVLKASIIRGAESGKRKRS